MNDCSKRRELALAVFEARDRFELQAAIKVVLAYPPPPLQTPGTVAYRLLLHLIYRGLWLVNLGKMGAEPQGKPAKVSERDARLSVGQDTTGGRVSM